MKMFERFTGQSIRVSTLPGLEPKLLPKREPKAPRPSNNRWRSGESAKGKTGAGKGDFNFARTRKSSARPNARAFAQ